MATFGEVRLAFGQSDEYSFVFPKNSDLYGEAKPAPLPPLPPPAAVPLDIH